MPQAVAQIKRTEEAALVEARLGPATAVQHRAGVEITARKGAVRDIRATIAVPLECPEQTVRIVDDHYTPEVADADFRQVAGGEATQLFVRIPYLQQGSKAVATVTYEVTTHTIRPPEQTDELVAPRKPPRDIKRHLGTSPMIDVNHRKIRAAVAEALEGRDEEEMTDWDRAEAFYDYALEHVDYRECDDKSSVAALTDGWGDCQAVGALFVAMCRTAKIPARMVWCQDHQYAEFYLESPEGEGLWYPVETAGTRAFGGMPTARTILQKGDNFKSPLRPRERLRYASDYLKGFPTTPGGGKPTVRYVHEEQ